MYREKKDTDSTARIEALLKVQSREPFQEVLAELLASKPTKKSLMEFAKNHPDRWAQAVAIFGRGAGYSDKSIVEHNFYHHILSISDGELLALNEEYSKRLKALDGTCETLPSLPEERSNDTSLSDEQHSNAKGAGNMRRVQRRKKRNDKGNVRSE